MLAASLLCFYVYPTSLYKPSCFYPLHLNQKSRITFLKMERLEELLLMLFLVFASVPIAMGNEGGGGGGEGWEGWEERFLLQKKEQVMKTEAGEFTVVRGKSLKGMQSPPMDIGFINMEPSSLLLPQYMDSTLIIFVRKGEARIGWIYKDDLVEKELGIGDLYVIPAGSTFYIANIGEGQRLQLVTSIHKEESFGSESFQSFFIGGGGGWYPTSVFSGFGSRTMATALNVSTSELEEVLSRIRSVPIIHANVTKKRSSSLMKQMKKVAEEEDDGDDEEIGRWTWRKFFNIGVPSAEGNKSEKKKRVDYPDAYNLYKRKPDFENNYGSTWSLYGNDYTPLHTPGVSVYLVKLTAGSMLAPHLNPIAIEYGTPLLGSGTIQVVYPNGSTAMNAEVGEDDVFWVPRYYPFCQIASRNGPFVFFGFTTSSQDNMPQFLVGASSILRTMNTPELAAALSMNPRALDRLVKSQKQSAIFPASPASPPAFPPPQMDEGSEVVIESFFGVA